MPARAGIQLTWIPSVELVANIYFEFLDRLDGLEYPMREIVAEVITPEIEANFDQQGRPEKWAPLSEATILKRMYASEAQAGAQLVSDFENVMSVFDQFEINPDAFLSSMEGRVGGMMEAAQAWLMEPPAGAGLLAISGDILMWTGLLYNEATDAGGWEFSQMGRTARATLGSIPAGGGMHPSRSDADGYGIYALTGSPQRDWTYVSEAAMDRAAEMLLDWVSSPWLGGWESGGF